MDIHRIEERLKSAEHFLETAKYLDSDPPVAVPFDSSPTAIEEIKDRQRWSSGITCHMLYAIVFEISIKIIWELDNNEECRFTHDIGELFDELGYDSQQRLGKIFDEKSTTLAQLQGTNKRGNPVRVGDLVEIQSLRDALKANEDVMKNFKYETRYNGKSSVMGSVIWSDELVWILPQIGERLPEALYRYVVDRVERAKQG